MVEQPLKDHIAGAEAGFPKCEMLIEQMIALDVALHITYEIEDGKIVNHWMLMDNAGIMQQLGLVSSAS